MTFSKHTRVVLLGVSLFVVWQTGCTARKAVTSNYTPFRFQTFDNASLLLTPSVAQDQPSESPLGVKAVGRVPRNAPANKCVLEMGPFGLEEDPSDNNSLMLTLPPAKEWLARLEGASDADNGYVFDLLDAFLTNLNQLQAAGCLEGSLDALRDSILQSIPTRPGQSLLNAYGYRADRGSLSLKPSLRLKVERAYFRGPESVESESPAKNFKGLSRVYFNVKTDADGKISFQPSAPIKFLPASLAHTDQEGKRDLALGALPPQSSYRLFFYSYQVPTQRKRSATVIGGTSAGQLDAIEAKLRANPEENCAYAVAGTSNSCYEFLGFVTAGAQVGVSLNGKSVFLDWDAKVWNALPDSPSIATLQSLHIQRRFKDGYADVLFDPSHDDILSLVLVGGDRLTWSPPQPTAP